MGTQATYRSQLDLAQTYDTALTSGGTTALVNSTQAVLDGSSTPVISEGDYFEQAMTAGAATIDLTAITTSRGRSVNLSTGAKRPRLFKIIAPATNAAAVTIAKGAANGYAGFGANFSVALLPGMEVTIGDQSTAGVSVVDATHKNLDLSGTGTDKVQISFGAGA